MRICTKCGGTFILRSGLQESLLNMPGRGVVAASCLCIFGLLLFSVSLTKAYWIDSDYWPFLLMAQTQQEAQQYNQAPPVYRTPVGPEVGWQQSWYRSASNNQGGVTAATDY